VIPARRKDADKVEVARRRCDPAAGADRPRQFAATWMTAPLAAPVTLQVVVRDHALNQSRQELTLGD
jgi:hypothetical protein